MVTNDGRAVATVTWTGGRVEQFAAEQIRDYVETMTGVRLPVVQASIGGSAPDGGAVVIRAGRTASVPAAWLATARAMLEGAPEDTLALLSGEDHIALVGVGSRGTLFAAYALLEQFGVRFFAPKFAFYEGAHEVVPRQAGLTAPPQATIDRPAWALRRRYVEEGYSHTDTSISALIDWMAKNRLNTIVIPADYLGIGVTTYDALRTAITEAAQKRGIMIEVGGHGYESYLPPEEYPQFYTTGSNVFDVFNEAALQTYIGHAVAYLKARPEIAIFDCWPPDGASYTGELRTRYGKGANAESVVVNALTARLRQELPHVRVERIAYYQTVEPPDPDYACDPEVIVDYAPYSRSFDAGLGDPSSPANRNQSAPLTRWRSTFAGSIAMYEYYWRYRWRSLPVQPLDVVVLDTEWEQSLPVQGMGMYSEPADWCVKEYLQLFVSVRSWSPDIDLGSHLDGYLTARFGADTVSPMRRYFEAVRRDADGYASNAAAAGGLEAYRTAHGTLLEARAVCLTRAGRLVLDRLIANTEIAMADMRIGVLTAQGSPDLAQARADYWDLVQERRFHGVVLPNMQVIWRRDGGSSTPYASVANRREVRESYAQPAYGWATPAVTVKPETPATVRIRANDVDFAGHTIDWVADVPAGMTLTPAGGTLTVSGTEGDGLDAVLAIGDAPAGQPTLIIRFATGGVELNPASVRVTAERPLSAARIDAGASVASTDTGGRAWLADAFYVGGTTARWANNIAGTDDDELYRTFRRSSAAATPLRYRLPMRNGTYSVTLGFIEPYYATAGSRVFDVVANGTTVIDDLDILAESGSRFTAIERSFTTTITGGILELSFPATRDLALVCTIDVQPQ
ncbi:DUF4838 domain-containing protein [Micromonospora sp. NPDC050200]|uniref:DUF4838 domain-containing protein n=1 Tax=Micromonospora sp. NPDC050200 TaxID=3155664 RepID=UPI0033CFD7C8